ncbi:hypothetical protein [Xanthobacter aminoxidans]|uniref:hypothetical protein n=1 Tax=Xanthobacter aminoxidans TaxID=186280 RepID=UPI0020230722|nr:hypothetical protein [Xanthobacter aminoxidans]MCL8385502.1 hypothetical protein [Xanthobacter aminoxidans]
MPQPIRPIPRDVAWPPHGLQGFGPRPAPRGVVYTGEDSNHCASTRLQWPQSGISPDVLRRAARNPDEALALLGEPHGPRLPRRMPVGFGSRPAPRSVVCIGDGCGHCAAERGEPYRPRRAPIGFGDPPRAEARLAPLFLAGGVLAALLIAFLRSL